MQTNLCPNKTEVFNLIFVKKSTIKLKTSNQNIFNDFRNRIFDNSPLNIRNLVFQLKFDDSDVFKSDFKGVPFTCLTQIV